MTMPIGEFKQIRHVILLDCVCHRQEISVSIFEL